jgi:hypothetical protein
MAAVVASSMARLVHVRVVELDEAPDEADKPRPAADEPVTAAADADGEASLLSAPESEELAGAPALAPDPAVGLAMTIVLATLLLLPTSADLDGRARLVDRSRDTLAAEWTDDALAVMEPNAVIVSWWSYSTPLWYAQHIEGRRTDIRVVDDRTRLDEGLGEVNDVIDANLGRSPVYVIRLQEDLAEVTARFDLEPAGAFELYRVVDRVEAPE